MTCRRYANLAQKCQALRGPVGPQEVISIGVAGRRTLSWGSCLTESLVRVDPPEGRTSDRAERDEARWTAHPLNLAAEPISRCISEVRRHYDFRRHPSRRALVRAGWHEARWVGFMRAIRARMNRGDRGADVRHQLRIRGASPESSLLRSGRVAEPSGARSCAP